MNFVDVSNFILVVVALANVFFGMLVILNTRQRTTAQVLFTLLALTVAGWTLSMALYRWVTQPEEILIALKLLYVTPIAIPLLFVFFARAYAGGEQSKILQSTVPWTLMVWAGSLILLVVSTETIVVSAELCDEQEKHITFGTLYILYVLYHVAAFSIGFLLLLRHYIRASALLLRRQTLFLLIGTITSSVVALITNVLLPWTGRFGLNWFGNLATVFFVGFIFYAIVHHKLFNMRLVAAQLFVGMLWFILLVKMAVYQSITELVVDVLVLVSALVLGVVLVRSVNKEIQNREKGERLARYLANANARLRELDKQKTEFVSIASHQLRSPIAAIKGYSSLICEGSYGKVPDKLVEPLTRILDSGQRIGIMVDDFLNVTRIEQGRMTYSMAPKNLCEIVAEVTGELAVVAQKRDITLASNCDIETSPWVYADAGKLKQIFSNLIDNAIKYTPKGSITVSVTVRKQANMALVAIKDTGIGIAPDEISSLFHKFNRASNANEQNVLGTGLGLYIAREIVKAHNGWVHVESPGLGKGSTFTAELPMVDPPEPSEEKKDTDKE